jgi:hypothetical protein
MPQAEFLGKVKKQAAKGAACPGDSSAQKPRRSAPTDAATWLPALVVGMAGLETISANSLDFIAGKVAEF